MSTVRLNNPNEHMMPSDGPETEVLPGETKSFLYNGIAVSFLVGDEVMVNATEMAKLFKKRPSKWLELPSSQEFLNELQAVRKSDRLINRVNGVGTWMHADVAIEFARWLSPAFSIWCNDRIKEIMKFGFTATPQTLEKMMADPDFIIKLATDLKVSRQETEKLQAENNKLKPRSEFVDKVFDSTSLITIGQTAKVLKLPYGRNSLFKTLREKGVFFKNSNEPKQEYVAKGYFEIKEQAIEVQGKQKIVMQTYTTQKGLAYIAKILGVVTVPGYVTPIIN